MLVIKKGSSVSLRIRKFFLAIKVNFLKHSITSLKKRQIMVVVVVKVNFKIKINLKLRLRVGTPSARKKY
jgi:hypothetical protein